jgi:hypothetical protein
MHKKQGTELFSFFFKFLIGIYNFFLIKLLFKSFKKNYNIEFIFVYVFYKPIFKNANVYYLFILYK